MAADEVVFPGAPLNRMATLIRQILTGCAIETLSLARKNRGALEDPRADEAFAREIGRIASNRVAESAIPLSGVVLELADTSPPQAVFSADWDQQLLDAVPLVFGDEPCPECLDAACQHVDATYARTQTLLEGDPVVVYRVLVDPDSWDEAVAQMSIDLESGLVCAHGMPVEVGAASRWTSNYLVARQTCLSHEGRDRLLLRMRVPAEMVLGLPETGWGSAEYAEVRLIPGRNYTADVVALEADTRAQDCDPFEDEDDFVLSALESYVQEGNFDSSRHPRNDHGRFISAGDLQAAKSDPAEAAKLRAETNNPAERQKLDALIGADPNAGQPAGQPAAPQAQPPAAAQAAPAASGATPSAPSTSPAPQGGAAQAMSAQPQPEAGPAIPPSDAPEFDRQGWTSVPMGARQDAWVKINVRDRDRFANPGVTINQTMAQHLDGLPEWPQSQDLAADVNARLQHFTDRITPGSLQKMGVVLNQYQAVMQAAGADPAAARELVQRATDMLAAQEMESMTRQLGDHGVSHIGGNIATANAIFDQLPGGATARERAMMQTAQLFHDTGYLTPPSQTFLDEGHPRWGAQYFREHVAPLCDNAFGEFSSLEMEHVIMTHDATNIDWNNDPLGSAIRVADNTSLFHAEKLPAVFRDVPGNLELLKQLGQKKLQPKDVNHPELLAIKDQMRANIAQSQLPDRTKSLLTRAVDEVVPLTAKFTLGMLGGKLTGVQWTGDHIEIQLQPDAGLTELNKLGDFGQAQFGKLAKSYKLDPNAFTSTLQFEFKDAVGQTLLSSRVLGKLTEALAKLYAGLSLVESYFGGPALSRGPLRVLEAWDESEHPRAEHGLFTEKGDGSQGAGAKKKSRTASDIVDDSYAKLQEFRAADQQAVNYVPGDEEQRRKDYVVSQAHDSVKDLSEDDYVSLLRSHDGRKDMAQGNAVKLLGRVAGLGNGKRAKAAAEKAFAEISPTRFHKQHYSQNTNEMKPTAGVDVTNAMLPTEGVWRAIHRFVNPVPRSSHEMTLAEFLEDRTEPKHKAAATRARNNLERLQGELSQAEAEHQRQSLRAATAGGSIQAGIERDQSAVAERLQTLRKQVGAAKTALSRDDSLKYLHQTAVRTALKEGKTVPPEVLKDYPELAAPMSAPSKSGPASVGVAPSPAEQAARDELKAHLESEQHKTNTIVHGGLYAENQVRPLREKVHEATKETLASYVQAAAAQPPHADLGMVRTYLDSLKPGDYVHSNGKLGVVRRIGEFDGGNSYRAASKIGDTNAVQWIASGATQPLPRIPEDIALGLRALGVNVSQRRAEREAAEAPAEPVAAEPFVLTPDKPKPKPKPAEFETIKGKQQTLFGKKGLAGQRMLFDDGATPKDLIQKGLFGAESGSEPRLGRVFESRRTVKSSPGQGSFTWNEEDHPRGNPQNRGQFTKKGTVPVVTETGHKNAAVLVSQGIRAGLKPRINPVDEYAPGRGVEINATYVKAPDAERGNYGNVRIHYDVPAEQLDVPEELKQSGWKPEEAEKALQSNDGAVVRGDVPPAGVSKVEVYNEGNWDTYTPAEYLEQFHQVTGEVPRLPTIAEYREELLKHQDFLGVPVDKIEDTVGEYARSTLDDKLFFVNDLRKLNEDHPLTPVSTLESLTKKYAAQLEHRMAADAGVHEGYTIGEHTARVLNVYARETDPKQVAALSQRLGMSLERLLPAVLVLHDAGKADAIAQGDKHRQHEFTLPLLAEILRKEGFSDREVRMAKLLVGHDMLGELLKGRETVEDTAADFVQVCEAVGFNPSDALELQKLYFKADTASYPYLEGKLYRMDLGRLEFSSPKMAALTAAVAQLSQTQEPALEDHTGWTKERKIADWKEHGVRSRVFKDFFGDWESHPENASKVVNAKGEPQGTHEIIKVYHGAAQDIDAFDPARIGEHGLAAGTGFYFAENKKIAETYANNASSRGGKVIEAYLNVRHPFDIDGRITKEDLERICEAVGSAAPPRSPDAVPTATGAGGPVKVQGRYTPEEDEYDAAGQLKKTAQLLRDKFAKEVATNQKHDGESWDGSLHGGKVHTMLDNLFGNANVNGVLERAGFDGLVHTSEDEWGTPNWSRWRKGACGRCWVVFKSNQIKAVDNLGTFDPSSPNIHESFVAETREFHEEDVVRDDHGQFADKDGATAVDSQEAKPKWDRSEATKLGWKRRRGEAVEKPAGYDDLPDYPEGPNEKLVKQIKAGDQQSANDLLRENEGLVVKLARRFTRDPNQLDELKQEGRMAMLTAADRYDPKRGAAFSTYATDVIRGQLNHYWNRVMLKGRGRGETLPDGEEGRKNREVMDDTEFTPEGRVALREQEEAIRKAVSTLSPDEALVVKLQHGLDGGEPQSLAQIGEKLGLTKQRAWTIAVSAKNKLIPLLEKHKTLESQARRLAEAWEADKHPRGNPRNPGQFSKGGLGGGIRLPHFDKPVSLAEKPAAPAAPADKPRATTSEEQDHQIEAILTHVDGSLAEAKLEPAQRASYRTAFDTALSRMPEQALDAVRTRIKHVAFYPSKSEVNDAYDAITGRISESDNVTAFVNQATGEMHLDGLDEKGAQTVGDLEGCYAHELSHLLDQPTGDPPVYTSDDNAWQAAWKAEICQQGYPLTKYAAANSREGFAEFGRLMYSDPATAKAKFPQSWAFFEQLGYAPQDVPAAETKAEPLAEVFDVPHYAPNGYHADCKFKLPDLDKWTPKTIGQDAKERWTAESAAEWDESKHPRDRGKFTHKGGGDSTAPVVSDNQYATVTAETPPPELHATVEHWQETLTQAQQAMLHDWGTSGRVRRLVQAEQPIPESDRWMAPRYRQDMPEWDALLDSAPKYSGTVYRGMSLVPDEQVHAMAPGSVITLQNDQSSSRKASEADKWHGESRYGGASMVWEVDQHSGALLEASTDVFYGDDAQLGGVDEAEVVLRKGSKYRVASIHFVDEQGQEFPPPDYAEQLRLEEEWGLQGVLERVQDAYDNDQRNEAMLPRLRDRQLPRLNEVKAQLQAVKDLAGQAELPPDFLPHQKSRGHYVVKLQEVVNP